MEDRKYVGHVVEEDGELLLVFPAKMMEDLGWEVGDTIVWDMPDGSNVIIAKKAKDDANIPK